MKEYEQNKMFQDVLSIKLSWVEFVVDEQGKVNLVRCKVCSKIDGKDKCLPLKLTTFENMLEEKRP